jgi:hypothetical protein
VLKPQVIETQTRTLAPRASLDTAMLLVEIQVLAMALVVLDRIKLFGEFDSEDAKCKGIGHSFGIEFQRKMMRSRNT